MSNHTFHKNERLKSRKTNGKIFQEGQSFISYPLRIAWVPRDNTTKPNFPVQFTQSVPKRRFSKAVDRNRIRRRIREAYRLNKHLINDTLDHEEAPQFGVIAIYIGKEELPYDVIFKATQKWINTFLRKVKSQKNIDSQPTKNP